MPTPLKIGVFLILIPLVLLLGQVIFDKYYLTNSIKYGVSFSPKFASDLNLDWKDTYVKILDELKVKNLRLPTYWDDIEATREGGLDFSRDDFILEEAGKRGARVILVLGARQPRWPECHIPPWASKLSVKDKQIKILEFIKKVVQRYNNDSSIKYWQVENEPLLGIFGQCDPPDEKFLKKEVDLVRSLSRKPVIVTDSGELGFWISPMRLSDVFGTTLYRRVYNSFLGYTTYPLLPYFYNIKSTLVRNLFSPKNLKTIIVELQAEPWSPSNSLVNTKISQQVSGFGINNFKDNINFAKETGFDEFYLWGVEWWYFMDKNGHPEYLDYAKTLFK